jgi:hypothetical protein
MLQRTLFGQVSGWGERPWPEGHGSRPQLIERTLFTGKISLWRTAPWPEGYGPP